MELIEAVSLVYDNENRIAYQDYAEFFRLIGIYVSENLKDSGSETGSSIDGPVFIVGDGDSDVARIGSFLEEKKFEESDILEQWFDDLVTIYKKHNLLQASVTLQYFRMNAPEVLQAGDQFEQAADELVELVREKKDLVKNKYVRYAKLYCKQKANLARFYCEEPVLYYVDDLAREGLSLIKVSPDSSSAWALLGLIYENTKDFAKDAMEAFLEAIKMVGEKPYASSIYYWLGHHYEKYLNLKEDENKAYMKAYQLMPKYRNMYKVATRYMGNGEWEKAIRYFEECIQSLEGKENFLDPLEQEYYFKVNVHMSYMYLKLTDNEKASNYAQKAINFRKNIESGYSEKNEYTRFYFEMYSDADARKYIDLELKRMGTKQAYQYLAKASQEMGLKEEAEKYWELAKA